MKSRPFFLFAALLVSFFGWGAGCGGLPSYQINVSTPHKDVLRLLVILESRAAPEVYREIALQEMEKARAQSRYWPHPLYEVSVDFRLDSFERDRLAHVLVRLGGEAPSAGGMIPNPGGEAHTAGGTAHTAGGTAQSAGGTAGSIAPVVETTLY